MVENLNDLLALDHLLDIAVDIADSLLLGGEVPAAAAADGFDHQQHHRQHQKRYSSEDGAEDDHHCHGAEERQRAGNEACKAVVQRLGHCFNIVGIPAHQLAVGMGIEEFQGEALHFVKQVRPELCHGILRHMDHDAGVAIGAQGAHSVHAAHDCQHFRKPRKIAGENIIVDEGLNEVRARHGAGGADEQQHHHDHQQRLIPPQIAHELFQRTPQVLGLAEAAPRAAAGTAGSPSCLSFSHRCSLLPVGIHRPRGKYRRPSSIPHGYPVPPRRRRSSLKSDLRP